MNIVLKGVRRMEPINNDKNILIVWTPQYEWLDDW